MVYDRPVHQSAKTFLNTGLKRGDRRSKNTVLIFEGVHLTPLRKPFMTRPHKNTTRNDLVQLTPLSKPLLTRLYTYVGVLTSIDFNRRGIIL